MIRRPDWIRLMFWLGVLGLLAYALVIWLGVCPL